MSPLATAMLLLALVVALTYGTAGIVLGIIGFLFEVGMTAYAVLNPS